MTYNVFGGTLNLAQLSIVRCVGMAGVDATGWIFDATTDTVVVPLVLSLIGLVAVVSNVIVVAALVGVRRMRSGPNLMLANLAAAGDYSLSHFWAKTY